MTPRLLERNFENFFTRIVLILGNLVHARVVTNNQSILDYDNFTSQLYTKLVFDLPTINNEELGLAPRVHIQLISATDGGPGLALLVDGSISADGSFGEWDYGIGSNAEDLLRFTQGGLDFNTALGLFASLRPSFDSDIILGSSDQSRIEVNTLELKTSLNSHQTDWIFDIKFNAKGKIDIDSNNGDSFLTKVTQGKGIPGDFDINIGYSTDRGFYLGLGAGLSTVLHIDKKILNAIHIGDMPIELAITEEGIQLDAGLNITVDFKGRIIFKVENMGLRTAIDFTAPQKNIGIGDLSFDFKGPNGIGVSIKAGAVVGAGYLYIGEDEYKGYLYLNVADKFALTVIAMLNTSLPGDEDGYAFLGLITLDLPKAIPIAFGFYLKGVGGLVALNRTMNTDAIRTSVRTGSLNNLLFPEIDPDNIETTFATILNDLDNAFPIKEGSHSFAIMGKFNYAEKDVVNLDLGLLVSIGNGLVLGLAGVLYIRQPEENGSRITLNAAFLAIVDFGEKLFSLDVSIYDSAISGMPIEGDIALRFGWGEENRQFIFSAGGFHPSYEVSDVMRIGTMKRITLIIRNEEKLKISAQFYTAVTSNTFQVGARTDLYAKVGPFSITAYFGFDALFNFDPFYFLVRIYLGVALKKGNKALFSIDLELDVKGPKAWHVRGKATFKILKIKKTFKLDKVFGDDANDQIEKVDVRPLLLEAFGKNSSWITTNSDLDRTITFISIESGLDSDPILNPIGQLVISENIVPLELPMNVFGEKPIQGASYFEISEVRLNPGTPEETIVPTNDTEDFFATAQFVKLSNQEKLKSKSYELNYNGVQLKGDAFGNKSADHTTARVMEYEPKYREGLIPAGENGDGNPIYNDRVTVSRVIGGGATHSLSANEAQKSIAGGAYGRSSAYRKAKKRSARKPKVRMRDIEYSVASRDNLGTGDTTSRTKSRTKAELLLRDNIIGGPEKNNLTVTSDYVMEHAEALMDR